MECTTCTLGPVLDVLRQVAADQSRILLELKDLAQAVVALHDDVNDLLDELRYDSDIDEDTEDEPEPVVDSTKRSATVATSRSAP